MSNDFLSKFIFDFSQPHQAIRELKREANQTVNTGSPRVTQGSLASLQARGESAIAQQARVDPTFTPARQLAEYQGLTRAIQDLVAYIKTPSGRAGSLPANAIERERQRIGGPRFDLQATEAAALADEKARNPLGLPNAHLQRIARIKANAQAAQAAAANAPQHEKDALVQVRAINKLLNQIPVDIATRLGLYRRDIAYAVQQVHGLRAGQGPHDEGAKLAATMKAYDREVALRRGIYDEKALAVADNRTGGPIRPGPISQLKATNEVLGRQREVAEGLALERTLAGSSALAKAQADLAVLTRRREVREKTAFEKAVESDTALTTATARLAVMRRERAARESIEESAQARSSGTTNLEARAAVEERVNRAMQRQAEALELAKPVVPGGAISRADQIAAGRIADKRSAALIEQATQRTLEADTEYVRATAAAAASRRRIALKVAVEERRLLKETATPEERGTTFQKIQAYLANRREGGSTRLPIEFQRGGQFLASRALTTAGFAASGALLYGGVQFMKEMVREASELQVELGLVKAQFDDAGISAERFGQFRDTLIDISKETGVSADELARLARNLAGVFRLQDARGKDVGIDVGRVEQEVAVAAKFSEVTGVTPKQIKDDMVAVVTSFKDVDNLTFSQLADQLVGLENRTGVAAGELLNFTATLAPLAAELGFTTKELASLGAVASQVSGKPASTLAENIGRVLTDLSDKTGLAQQKLLSFYASVPQLRGSLDGLAADLASGDIDKVVTRLLQDYGKLDATRRSELTKVFGKREAQSFVALLNNSQVALRELERGDSADAGAFDERWKEHAKTVTFAFKQMERSVEELGIMLFDLGLADVLGVVAISAKILLEVLKGVLTVTTGLNDATGGMVGKMIAAAVAIKLVTAAVKALRAAEMGEGIRGLASRALYGAAAGQTGQVAAGAGASRLTPAALAAIQAANAGTATSRSGALAGRIVGGLGFTSAAPGFAAAGGYGLAAAVAPLAALAAIGTAGVLIKNRMDRASESANKFSRTLEKVSEADLARMARGSTAGVAFSGSEGSGVFGPSRQTLVRREQLRRESLRYPEAVQAGFNQFLQPVPQPGDAARNLALEAQGLPVPEADLGLTPAVRAGIKAKSDRQRKALEKEYTAQLAKLPAIGAGQDRERILDAWTARETVIDDAEALLLNPSKLDGLVGTLKDVKKEGRAGAKARANLSVLKKAIEQMPDDAKFVAQQALAQAEEIAASSDAGAKGARYLEQTQGNFDLQLAKYKRGTVSWRAVVIAYERDTVANRARAQAYRDRGEVNEEAEQALVNSTVALEQARDEAFKAIATRATAIGKLTGQNTQFAEVEAAVRAIRSPETSVEGDLAAADTIVTFLREGWDKRIAQAKTYEEAQKLISDGLTIPPEVRQALLQAKLNAPDNAQQTNLALADFIPKVGRPGAEGDVTRLSVFAKKWADATEEGRKEIIADLEARRDQLALFISLLGPGQTLFDPGQLETLLDAYNGLIGDMKSDTDKIQQDTQSAVDHLNDWVQGQADLAKSQTNDPQAQAQIDVDAARKKLDDLKKNGLDTTAAEAELNNALKAKAQVDQAVASALIDLQAARAGNDPVARADAAIAVAQNAKAIADGAEANARADIQLIEAYRQKEEALYEIDQANADLEAALADGDPLKGAQAKLTAAKKNPDLSGRNGRVAQIRAFIAVLEAQKGVEAAMDDIRKADEEFAQSFYSNNAVEAAKAGVAAARAAFNAAKGQAERVRTFAALIAAQRAFEDAIVDEAVAGQELGAAIATAHGNGLAAAKANLEIARIRLAAATAQGAGKAELKRLMAQVVAAEAAVAEQIFDITVAQLELVGAMADVTGDIVGSAEANLAIALAKLQQVSKGGGAAEIARAQAEVLRAQAAVRDARLQDQQSDIDFMLQMEQITTGEAIKQLEALLQVPNLTKQQTQALLLKIKQLRDQLGADYQFNLPSFLGLPTLYESRRLDQSDRYQAGRGQAPASNITVNVYPSEGMDEGALADRAVARLGDALSAPSPSSLTFTSIP